VQGEIFQDLLVDWTPPLAIVRINRPEARNACQAQTLKELRDVLVRAGMDGSIRAIVLSGVGKHAFCAGADLKEMASLPSNIAIRERMEGWWNLIDTLRAMRKPLIAAVRGFAVGGGTEIALSCHIVIASESAKFGLPEIKRGHISGAGGTVHLPRRIGSGPAAYYLLTGDDISAREAERFGFVAKVVSDEQLDTQALAVARHLATLSPVALAGIIETIVHGFGATLEEANALERKVCAAIRGSDDFNEGLKAFVEKREPRYGGSASHGSQ
jgi:enoyl-CoA hydratase